MQALCGWVEPAVCQQLLLGADRTHLWRSDVLQQPAGAQHRHNILQLRWAACRGGRRPRWLRLHINCCGGGSRAGAAGRQAAPLLLPAQLSG